MKMKSIEITKPLELAIDVYVKLDAERTRLKTDREILFVHLLDARLHDPNKTEKAIRDIDGRLAETEGEHQRNVALIDLLSIHLHRRIFDRIDETAEALEKALLDIQNGAWKISCVETQDVVSKTLDMVGHVTNALNSIRKTQP